MFARMQLSERLNLIVISINIIVLVIVAVLASISSDAALREQAVNRFASKNSEAVITLNTFVENLSVTVDALAVGLSEFEDLNDSAAVRDYLTDFLANDADILIHRVALLRPDDAVAVLNIPNPRLPTEYSWRIFRRTSQTAPSNQSVNFAADTNTPTWFRQSPARYDTEERDAISLAIPFENNDETQVFWIDIPIDVLTDEVTAVINNEGLLADTQNGYALLIDANGIILTTHNLPVETDAPVARTARDIARAENNAQRDANGLYRLDDPFNDGAPSLFAGDTFESNGWLFTSTLPVDEIPQLTSGIYLPVLAVALVGVLALTYAVRQFVSAEIVTPIDDLQRSASEIGDGNLRYTVFHKDKQDEIGRLARSLDSMKNRLRESYDALRQWSFTLEQRVEERTEQMRSARREAEANATQLQAIYDESLSVVNEAQLGPVLDTFMKRITALLDANYVAVWLGSSENDRLQLVATTDPRRRTSKGRASIDPTEGIVGQVIMQANPIIVDDYINYPHRIRLTDYYEGDAPFNRAVCAPLTFAGHPIGAVVVGRPSDADPFNRDDERQLTLFTNLVSSSVRNAQLFVQLRAAVQEAERANEVKTRFLASVTHELRTPLNLIINNMDFMRVGAFGEVTDDQVSRLNQTVRSAEHLLYLINDLLDVSKIEAGEMQMFIQMNDVNTMIEDAVDNAYALLETYEDKSGRVDIATAIEDELPELPMDTRRIRQVLNNLLSNAIKFTRDGDVTLKVNKVEDGIRFSITDTGMGIPQEEMDILFAAFERTREAKERNIEGTGLGLPISQYLVQQHGGEIKVSSQVNVGTTFSFTIPFERSDDGNTTDTQQMSAILTSKPTDITQ